MTDPNRRTDPAPPVGEPDPTAALLPDTLDPLPGQTQPSPPVAPGPARHTGPPARLGPYRVLKLLGRGGMGAVYAAEDPALHRPVALKTMRPELARDPDARERFLREARAAAAVESDHVVRIYQVGEDGGVPFIAMEFLRGKPLDAWMKDRTPTVAQILKIGYEVALGLAAAHERGLVHRDIKPSNLWLEAPSGRVKVLDFGLARSAREEVELTGSGVIVGTPAYMAPEQARGEAVDFRCDLFSLGAVLYQLATGRRPFAGPNAMAILASLALDDPAPPHELNPAVPPALSGLVMRLLAKRPERRPGSAREAAEELRRIYKGEAAAPPVPEPVPVIYAPPAAPSAATLWEDIVVSGAPTDALVEPVRKPRAWPIYAATAGVVAVSLAVAAGAWWMLNPPGSPTPAQDDPPTLVKGKSEGKGTPPGKPFVRPGKDDPPPADLIPPMTPVKPEKVFTLDHLDPKDIPPEERFDWQPKELVAVIGSHKRRMPGGVSALSMSRDGRRVLATCGGKFARVWDVETRREVPCPGEATVISPDGRWVADGDRVWDLDDPKKEPVKYPINSSITQFVTDQVVLARQGNDAILWRLDEAAPKPLGKVPDCRWAAASPDGKYLVALPSAADAALEVSDIGDAGVTRRCALPGPEGRVHANGPVSFSETGRLAVTAPDRKVRLWDLTDREPPVLATITDAAPDGAFNYVSLSARGDRVVCWNQRDSEIWAVDGREPRRVAKCSSSAWGGPRSLVIAPDGRTMVTGSEGGVVGFWGIENDVIFERDPLRPQPANADLAVSPDGRTLALQDEEGVARLWDLTGPIVRPLPWNEKTSTATWSPGFGPDGRSLVNHPDPATGNGLHVWGLDPQAPPRPGAIFGRTCSHRPGFSPDGKLLAAIEHPDALVVWDVSGPTPAERYRLPGTGFGGVVEFTPDGRYLVGCSPFVGTPPVIVVWAVTEKGLVERDRQTFESLSCAALSPDGKMVARSGHEAAGTRWGWSSST